MVNLTNLATILDPGDIIVVNGSRFRLLSFQKESTLIQMDTTKIHIETIDMDILLDGIKSGRIQVLKKEQSIILLDEENHDFKKRLALIRDIEDKYNSVLEFYLKRNKEVTDRLMEKHGICKELTWYCIRVYMQSGYDESSLMPSICVSRSKVRPDQKRRGKNKDVYIITEKDSEAIAYALRKYNNNPDINFLEAYILMVCRFYGHIDTVKKGVVFPVTRLFDYQSRPTYYQLRGMRLSYKLKKGRH